MNSKRKLYQTLGLFSLLGYSWLAFSLVDRSDSSLCMIRHVTGIPCPSCGITRALMLLLNGDFGGAFLFNPMGYLAGLLLIVIPAWLLIDLIRNSDSLYKTYSTAETIIRKKIVYFTALVLLIGNWAWSISKGL